MDDVVLRLEAWYESRCEGSWEHQYGVRIETIDNPGWHIEIDLSGTPLIDQSFEEFSIDRTSTEWLRCEVQGSKFEAYCGPKCLRETLLIFLTWAERSRKVD